MSKYDTVIRKMETGEKWDCHKCCDKYEKIPCSVNKPRHDGYIEGCPFFALYEEVLLIHNSELFD